MQQLRGCPLKRRVSQNLLITFGMNRFASDKEINFIYFQLFSWSFSWNSFWSFGP